MLGLNMASYFPWSAFGLLGGVSGFVKVAKRAGYDFGQLIIAKSVASEASLHQMAGSGFFNYAEAAWNPTTFSHWWRSWRGFSVKNPSRLHDLLFFPPPVLAARSWGGVAYWGSIIPIFHHWKDINLYDKKRQLLEVSVSLGGILDPKQLLSDLSGLPGNVKLALDLKHWLVWADYRFDHAVTGLKSVCPEFVGLVHVQPATLNDWALFERGQWTEMEGLMVELLRCGYQGNWVVEYDPRAFAGYSGLLNPWGLVKHLTVVRKRCAQIINSHSR